MQLPTSNDFWPIVSVVISALGLYLALWTSIRKEIRNLRADMDREFERMRADIRALRADLQALDERTSADSRKLHADLQALRADLQTLREHVHRLERRIDRMEEHAREDRKELSAGLASLKAEVSALSARLDERSYPRRPALETVREEARQEYSGEGPEEGKADTEDGTGAKGDAGPG